jgi:hypothetical protein
VAKIPHRTVGSLWTPQFTFTVGVTNTDPTNLTVRIQNAAGTESVLLNNVLVSTLSGVTTPVAKTATGVFKLNPGVTLDASGFWFAKAEGTGAAQATIQEQVNVDPDEFTSNAGLDTRALVSLAETKDWLKQLNVDVSSDLRIVSVINDISDRFHQEAEREFKPYGTNPATRSFPIEQTGPTVSRYIDGVYFGEGGPYSRFLKIGDLTSFTQVQIIDSTDWTTVLETVALGKITAYPTVRAPWEPITGLEFLPTVTALYSGMRVAVTGTWGFPAVPGTVRRAVLDAVAWALDTDVEYYREDLSVAAGGPATVQLSLPPAALAVAEDFRSVSLR